MKYTFLAVTAITILFFASFACKNESTKPESATTSVAGDELEMNTTFAQPGLYRGWLQFQTNGKVHTADFAIKVQ
jgi:uncharacterized membrane protein